MSFRPTIAVVINGKIADIGYYRNWPMEGLFIEALGLAVMYRDCRTIEEFREKAFGTQKVGYIVEPEVFENTQENLRFLEDCSEMTITVDLTRKAIYEGYSYSSDEYVRRKPEMKDMNIPVSRDEDFYWKVLSRCKISFDKIGMEKVAELFLNDEGLRKNLSLETAKKMRKMIHEKRS